MIQCLVNKKFNRQVTVKRNSTNNDPSNAEQDKSKLIDELLGFIPDSRGYNIELNKDHKVQDELSKQSETSKKMVKLGTLHEKIYITKLDEGRADNYVTKKMSNKLETLGFHLNDIVDRSTQEDTKKLQNMNLKRLIKMYKNADSQHKQKFESELIKMKYKKENTESSINRVTSEISRFNSPAIKLSHYVQNSNEKYQEDDDQNSTNEEVNRQSSHNILNKNFSRSSSKEMSVIDEDAEDARMNSLKFDELPHTKSHVPVQNLEDLNRPKLVSKFTYRSPSKKSKSNGRNVKWYFGPAALDGLFSEINKQEEQDFVAPETHGELIRWIEGQKLSAARFGDIVVGLNIKTGGIMTVKRLNLYKSVNNFHLEWVESVKAELSVLKNYSHKHIIEYYGSEVVKDKFLIYIGYASEGNLVNIYKKYGPLNEEIIRSYTSQILEGLQYLHSNNISHYDIKGQNILVDSSGWIKISDFDCAMKIPILAEGEKQTLAAHKGTTPWMSPEVIEQKPWNLKSDIWSLGWTIIEIAIAGNPWGQLIKGTIDDMVSMINKDMKPPIPDHLSEKCKDFLLRCLVRDIEQRATCNELLEHPFITTEVE